MDIKRIIKGTLLTAIATIASADASAESVETISKAKNNDSAKDAADELIAKFGSNRIYKNVLKVKPNGELVEVAGHRSHMSHRSSNGGGYTPSRSTHRTTKSNHTSHSSSSYSGGSVTRSTSTTKTSGTSTSTKKSNTSSFYGGSKSTKVYSLGDRVLKYNSSATMTGDDVAELIALLIKAGYLTEDYKITWGTDDKAVYTREVAEAVMKFQPDHGLPATGIADKKTIEKLKNAVSQ